MTIKSILCIFGGAQEELNALNTSVALAKTHGALLRFLHVAPDPADYAGIYGKSILFGSGIADSITKENGQRLQKAQQYVTSFMAKHNIPLDQPNVPARRPWARFQHVVGMMDTTIAREGRLSDMIVIGKESNPAHDFLTPAIFDTGRPVLMVPPAKGDMHQDWQDKIVSLAWNGSVQASRALLNALPLLSRTEKLYILSVEKHGRKVAEAAGLMEYLKAHGISSQAILIAAGTRSTSDSLLSRTKELKSDLLIMGAFGQSMFREMTLGGVTEFMLKRADIPILLAH